jgi:hypothetical protein
LVFSEPPWVSRSDTRAAVEPEEQLSLG